MLAGAVAACHETEARLLDLGRRSQDRHHTVATVAHPGQLGAPLHRDPAVGQRPREHPLHVHLPHQRQVRESSVRQRKITEAGPDDPPTQVQVHCGRGVRPGQQRLRHPERAQHLQRPGMHDQRAGRPEHLRPPVDDPDSGSVDMGLQGQRQSSRAGPCHQDAGRRGGGRQVPHGQAAHDTHPLPVLHDAPDRELVRETEVPASSANVPRLAVTIGGWHLSADLRRMCSRARPRASLKGRSCAGRASGCGRTQALGRSGRLGHRRSRYRAAAGAMASRLVAERDAL